MARDAYQSASEALVNRVTEWHRRDPDGCAIRFDAAARLAIESGWAELDIELEVLRRENRQLHRQLAGLHRSMARYERLADAVQHAALWDYSVYEMVPNDEWLAIDREDCERLVRALGGTDRWRPWRTVLERRLGDI